MAAAGSAARPLDEVLAAFEAAEAAAAPVYDMADIAADPHSRARDAIVEVDGMPMQGLVARCRRTPGRSAGPAALGADTRLRGVTPLTVGSGSVPGSVRPLRGLDEKGWTGWFDGGDWSWRVPAGAGRVEATTTRRPAHRYRVPDRGTRRRHQRRPARRPGGDQRRRGHPRSRSPSPVNPTANEAGDESAPCPPMTGRSPMISPTSDFDRCTLVTADEWATWLR